MANNQNKASRLTKDQLLKILKEIDAERQQERLKTAELQKNSRGITEA